MCVARKSHWAHPVSFRQPIGETFTIWLTFVGDSIVLVLKIFGGGYHKIGAQTLEICSCCILKNEKSGSRRKVARGA